MSELTTYNADEPWARQPCDTEASYVAFLRYLSLDPPRQLSKLVDQWPLPQLARWREDCAWLERAMAIDVMEGRFRPKASERDERHLHVIHDALELVTLEAKKLLRLSEGVENQVLEPREIVRLLREVVQLERLVSGASTENVAVAGQFDLSGLSVDELEQLRELQSKVVGE